MLAPAILPFQITVAIVLLLALGAINILPFYGDPARTVFVLTICASFILFIPTCLGKSLLVDFFRYGRFTYPSASEITDPYLSLPASAKNIVLFKYASGHDVRFSVDNTELMTWLKSNQAQQDQRRVNSAFDAELTRQLEKYGWPADDDKRNLEKYIGPITDNGAGFIVWYSPKNGIAYLHCGYW